MTTAGPGSYHCHIDGWATERGVSILERDETLYAVCGLCPSDPVITTNLDWDWEIRSYRCTNCKREFAINDGKNGARTARGVDLPEEDGRVVEFLSMWLDCSTEDIAVEDA